MRSRKRALVDHLKQVSWVLFLVYIILLGLVFLFGRQVGYKISLWACLGVAGLTTVTFFCIYLCDLLRILITDWMERGRNEPAGARGPMTRPAELGGLSDSLTGVQTARRPARADRAMFALALGAAVAPNWVQGAWLLLPAAVLVAALGRSRRLGRAPLAAVLGLVGVFVVAATRAPLLLVVVTLAYLFWAAARPAVREETGLRFGRGRRADMLLSAATGLASSGALAAWLAASRADLADLAAGIPHWSGPALVALAFGFGVVNAVIEEVLFRGVIWSGLASVLRNPTAVLLSQAACFGAAHYRGFPRGWAGAALAAVFGLLLGILRKRTGGLLWPVVCHVLPDIVIFLLVAGQAGRFGVAP